MLRFLRWKTKLCSCRCSSARLHGCHPPPPAMVDFGESRFRTTSDDAFGAAPKPDPPPPIGSRKELTQTNWKIGDARSESNGRHGSTFKTDFPVMKGEPGKQMRTKKQLTQTNWIGGDAKTQTWSCTNTLPKCVIYLGRPLRAAPLLRPPVAVAAPC